VLSVAGFFAVLGPFPLGGEEYPEVRKPSFLRQEAFTVGRTEITVITAGPLVDDGS